jgi:hypothetical protein
VPKAGPQLTVILQDVHASHQIGADRLYLHKSLSHHVSVYGPQPRDIQTLLRSTHPRNVPPLFLCSNSALLPLSRPSLLPPQVQSDSLSDAPVEAVHGHAAARTPIVRLMRTNLAGVGLHICHMSWWVGVQCGGPVPSQAHLLKE